MTWSLGAWKDEEDAKEATPLTARERQTQPFHGAPLMITCHNWRPDSQESNMPFPTQLAPCLVFGHEIKHQCYVTCQSYPGLGFGSGWARGLDGRGFSEWVAAPTRLSCPGFSCGGGLIARSNGKRSRVARRLRVQSGQYFTAMLFGN